MLWDTSLQQSLFNTLLVSIAAALLSTGLALALSLLIHWIRIPFAAFWNASVVALTLIPLYVQATAWSAGFGIQGWWRLSQVNASQNYWYGIGAVVWIHAVASVPFSYLILVTGISRMNRAPYDQALLERGPWHAMVRGIVAPLSPWIFGAAVWAFCMTQNDMVVTNLFQIPTLTESVYQQVQFGKLRSVSILASLAIALLCGVVAACTAMYARGRFSVEQQTMTGIASLPYQRTGLRIAGFAASAAMVAITVWLPLANLLSRIGWDAQWIDGRPVRAWSPSIAWHSIASVTSYASEFQWSCALAFYSSIVAVLLAMAAVAMDRNKWTTMMFGLVAGFLLALPGPVVNLFVIWLFDRREPEWTGYLAEHTLVEPLLALQCRCFPFAYVVLRIALFRYQGRYASLLQLEASRSVWRRSWLWIRFAKQSVVVAFLLSGMVAIADLASYLLVQPPGVTTIAMRMFEILHYGIRNREASLALVLAFFSATLSTLLIRVKVSS